MAGHRERYGLAVLTPRNAKANWRICRQQIRYISVCRDRPEKVFVRRRDALIFAHGSSDPVRECFVRDFSIAARAIGGAGQSGLEEDGGGRQRL